jgi:hypothetical protein
MRLVNTLFSQAIRFGEFRLLNGKQLYGRKLVQALEDRYGFIQTPRTVAEFDLTKGISFAHGYYDDRIVIQMLQIYNNGILVETESSTTECLSIIKDVTDLAKDEVSFAFDESSERPQIYQSHIEVETLANLQEKIVAFERISDELNRLVVGNNEIYRNYQFSGLSFAIDPTNKSGPSAFKFERRAGSPLDANLYFSSAPLQTNDHLHLLEVLEKAFSQTSAA